MTQYGANKPFSNLLKPHFHVHHLQQQTHSEEHVAALFTHVYPYANLPVHIKSSVGCTWSRGLRTKQCGWRHNSIVFFP